MQRSSAVPACLPAGLTSPKTAEGAASRSVTASPVRRYDPRREPKATRSASRRRSCWRATCCWWGGGKGGGLVGWLDGMGWGGHLMLGEKGGWLVGWMGWDGMGWGG